MQSGSAAPLDWAGMLQAGLGRLRLTPEAYWQLTPIELALMLGHAFGPKPLTRARLAELLARFPDPGRKPLSDEEEAAK